MEIYKQIKKDLTRTVGVMTLIFLVLQFNKCGYDDTDSKALGVRSGVSLIIDYRTGCNYLYRGWALIPRVDKNNDHICE